MYIAFKQLMNDTGLNKTKGGFAALKIKDVANLISFISFTQMGGKLVDESDRSNQCLKGFGL